MKITNPHNLKFFMVCIIFMNLPLATAKSKDLWYREPLPPYYEVNLPYSLDIKDHNTYLHRVPHLLRDLGWGSGSFRGTVVDPATAKKHSFFIVVRGNIAGKPLNQNAYQFAIYAEDPDIVAEVLRQMRHFMARQMGWTTAQLDKFNMLPLFDGGPQRGLAHPFQEIEDVAAAETLNYSASGRISFYDELKLAYTWALSLQEHFKVERRQQGRCEAALTTLGATINPGADPNLIEIEIIGD